MSRKTRAIALVGGAAGIAAGIAAQKIAVRRRHASDTEAEENFGFRRGERSSYIDLDDGGRLFVEEVGPRSSRAAIFIHGSALRTDLWHYQMAGLGGHRLIFYDLRGHGLSQPKGSTDFSVRTLAADLEKVIEATGVKEAVIVGHSIGGMVALELGHLRRDLLGNAIKGVVLVNTTPRPPVETIAGGAAVARFERLTRRPFDLIGTQASRIDRLRAVIKPSDVVFWGVSFAAFGPKASARQIDFTYDMLAETSSDVVFDLFKAYRGFDATDHLQDITVPVLVLAGSHDRITVRDASEHLAQTLPKAELKVFEGCGHMTMLERHEEVNELITTFLDDTLGRPRRSKRNKA
jgi:pimeloyl-ACP methyl ester carboxylesterase